MTPADHYAPGLRARPGGNGVLQGVGTHICILAAVSQPLEAGWDSGKATGWGPGFPGKNSVPTEPCSRAASFLLLGAWAKMEGFSVHISNLLMVKIGRAHV